MTEPVFPPSPQPSKKGTKRAATPDEEVDEVRAFKKRPKAAVNKPMAIPIIDKGRRQIIEMAQAKANPNASFAERVAQFDHMAELSQKRKWKIFNFPRMSSLDSLSAILLFRNSEKRNAERRPGVSGRYLRKRHEPVEVRPGLRYQGHEQLSSTDQFTSPG